MKLAEAYVEVKTNQKVFSKELKTMETSVNTSTSRMQQKMKTLGPTFRKVGIGVAALGGAIVAAGVLSIKTYSKMGDEVAKMAKRTGFSTEALSELRHAAEISGASLGALEKGVKRMSGTILDAEDGLETYIRSFRHIGIEVEELKGLKPEEQFMKIALAIAEVEDPTKRAAIAQDIFGRAGTELLPLFAEGAEGMAKLRQEAHDLGIVFSEEAARKAEEMTDAMQRVNDATSGLKIAIAGALIPVLMPLVDRVKEIITGFKDWMKAHPGLTSALAKVGVVLGPLLIALGGLLVILPSLVAIAPAVGAAFHIMLGPIGLVTAAIAAAVAAFLYFYKTNEKFAAFVNKIGGAIKTFVKDSWDRLVWFIKNWNEVWKAAGEIVKETLLFMGKAIWKVFTNKEAFIAFIKLWGTLYTSVGRIITDTMVFVGKVIARASSIIWAPIWESLKWLAEQFTYWFGKAENAILKAIGTAVNWVTGKFTTLVNFITQKVLNPIIAGFESFANAILGSIGWVIEQIIGLFGRLPNFILKAFGTSKEEVKQFATDIREKFEVELGRIPEIAEDALTIEIPQKTLQEPKKFADRMSDAWETIKGQYAAIPGDLAIYLDQLGEEWDTITTAAGEFGEAVDFAEYAGKIGALITKLKELGVDVTALEEAAGGADAKLEKLAKTLERIRDIAIPVGKKLTKSFDDFKDVAISTTADVDMAIHQFILKLHSIPEVIVLIPKAIQKAEDIITPAFDNFSVLIRDWIIKLFLVPEAVKPIPKAIAKAAEVIIPAGIDISAVIRDWYLALLGIPKAIKPIPEGIKKAEDIIVPAFVNFSIVIRDWYEELLSVPKAIKPIPKGIEKAEDVIIPAAANISAAIRDWYIALFMVPKAITPIPQGIKKAEDVIIAAGTNFSIIIRDWIAALLSVPEVIKPIPEGIKKAEDVIIPAAVDISAAIRDWYLALLGIPEAIKPIPRAIEKARDVMIGATDEQIAALLRQKSAWEKFAEGVKKYMGDAFQRMAAAAKDYFSKLENWLATALNLFAEVVKGTKSFGDALLELAYSIPVIGGIAEAVVNLVTAVWEWITGAAAAKQAMADMLEDIGEATGKLSEAFKDVGASLTGSINDAERAIRNLMQTQEDLALSTREKLIKELDNYYDYRVLKEMDLTELLALSAETREKLEKGTLEEIAESAEETAEREKDAKVGTLKAIEDAYAKESKLIDKKIKLIEIEIKLLIAAAEAEKGNLEEAERLRKEAMVSLNQLLYTREELNEKLRESRDATREHMPLWKEFGREGRKAADNVRDSFGLAKREIERLGNSTNQTRIGIEQWGEDGRRNAQKITEGFKEARIGIELWGEEINKLPKKIDFDIIGNLHIPDIPRISPRYFDIFGTYHAPSIPSAQIGIPYIPRTRPYVVHREEAILNPPQAREWRQGRGGERVLGEAGGVRIDRVNIEFPNVTSFQDWFNADPGLIKQVTERKILQAMKALAREGKVSKESVMMH